MWLLRKMHMNQKIAYIMKASHCCLEQNVEQELQMPRSFLGERQIYTPLICFLSYLLSESRDFWRDQVEEQQGEALWWWALKERGLPSITWECVQCFGSSGNPHATDIFHINTTKSFSCSMSLSAAAKISSEKMASVCPNPEILRCVSIPHTLPKRRVAKCCWRPHLRMTDLNRLF